MSRQHLILLVLGLSLVLILCGLPQPEYADVIHWHTVHVFALIACLGFATIYGARAAIISALIAGVVGWCADNAVVALGFFHHTYPGFQGWTAFQMTTSAWIGYVLPALMITLSFKRATRLTFFLLTSGFAFTLSLFLDSLSLNAGIDCWPEGGHFVAQLQNHHGQTGIPYWGMMVWGLCAGVAGLLSAILLKLKHKSFPLSILYLSLFVYAVFHCVQLRLWQPLIEASVALILLVSAGFYFSRPQRKGA